MTALPVLYSFRRCPYAMRARLALLASGVDVELREVVLRDKPAAMTDVSPKATVPVLVLADGTVIDESLSIMHWALEQSDPEHWLAHKDAAKDAGCKLIAENDGPFKHNLDRYKYPGRYENVDPFEHRRAGLVFLEKLNGMIANNGQLLSENSGLADHAIFPFIRQFAGHDRSWFDNQSLPALHDWLANHLGSPRFAFAMQKFPKWEPDNRPLIFTENQVAVKI